MNHCIPTRQGMCNGCPFNFTEESEQIQNYGCLAAPFDILKAKDEHNREWLCHSNEDRICAGLAQQRKIGDGNPIAPSEWYRNQDSFNL